MLSKLRENKRNIILIILFICFYITIYIIFRKLGISKEEIQRLIEPFGVYGILAMLVIQIIFSLTPIPDSAMPLVAMIIYGPLGVVVIMFGMFIAAIIHYQIGNHLGKNFIFKHFPETERYFNKFGDRNTIFKLVTMRLFTFVSFDITSYIAGISHIKFSTFLVATIIGLMPTNLILILVGYGLFAQNTVDIVITWGLIIIVFLLLIYFYKKNNIK